MSWGMTNGQRNMVTETIKDLETRLATGDYRGYTRAQTEAALAYWRKLAR